jgi:hypothetical protein
MLGKTTQNLEMERQRKYFSMVFGDSSNIECVEATIMKRFNISRFYLKYLDGMTKIWICIGFFVSPVANQWINVQKRR